MCGQPRPGFAAGGEAGLLQCLDQAAGLVGMNRGQLRHSRGKRALRVGRKVAEESTQMQFQANDAAMGRNIFEGPAVSAMHTGGGQSPDYGVGDPPRTPAKPHRP